VIEFQSVANTLQLPWYSVPESQANFTPRKRHRRRRRRNTKTPKSSVALPALPGKEEEEEDVEQGEVDQEEASPEVNNVESEELNVQHQIVEAPIPSTEDAASETSTIAPRSEPETPATSQAPSEGDFAQVNTPTTPAQTSVVSPKPQATQQHARSTTRSAIAVPNIPGLPRTKEATAPQTSVQDTASQKTNDVTPPAVEEQADNVAAETASVEETGARSPPPAAAPKSWADLVKRNTKTQAASGLLNGASGTGGIQVPQTAPLAEALKQYNVKNATQLAFLEPRGLVNTGNMCYMNSVSRISLPCIGSYTDQ
jgi:ubiquitin carboxyl-terminal hydrolase 10